MLSLKHVRVAEAAAARQHAKLSEEYAPVFACIERAALARKMIRIPGADPFVHHYYVQRMQKDAHELADELFALGLDLTYTTTAANRFSYVAVSVNGRPVAQLHRLPSHKGLHIYNVISPVDGMLSLELQLHDVYTRLCDPSSAEEWDSLATTEADLRAQFVGATPSEIIKGGSRSPFEELVLATFATKMEVVQVGAMKFATMLPWLEVQKIFRGLGAQCGARLRFDITTVNIPGNSQLERCSVTHGGGSVVVYNALTHRILPFFVEGGRRVAAGWGQALFLMVDVWVLRVVQALGKLPARAVTAAVRETQRALKKIDTRVPPPSNFAGLWVSEQAFMRRQAMEKRRFIPAYYPVNRTLGGQELLAS